MADMFAADITEGIAGTGIRAGMLTRDIAGSRITIETHQFGDFLERAR